MLKEIIIIHPSDTSTLRQAQGTKLSVRSSVYENTGNTQKKRNLSVPLNNIMKL